MDLLPKTRDEFRTKEYWNQFFSKRTDPFEWYGEYGEHCGVLHKYCKPNERLLMVGCGNSRISEDLYDVGYRNIVNIDIADVAIRQMKERNRDRRPDMEFIKMDMLEMDFESESFSVVFDKGALDAIFTGTTDDVLSDVTKMFNEIHRILKVGGRYICSTLAQDHILDKILEHFSNNGWFIRVHRIEPDKHGLPRPVFSFIFTKTQSSGMNSPSTFKLLELCINGTEEIKRVKSTEEIKDAVHMVQKYSLVKQLISMKFHPGDNFTFDLWSSDADLKEPRYSLTVVDSEPTQTHNGKFAIFIVPQGRETEWLFSAQEGLQQLASDASFQRLVVVALNRGHVYSSIDKVKEELSARVMELAPGDVTDSTQVPFLSVGGDIGIRETVHEGTSDFSGDYIVEDVILAEGDKFRRLVFLSNKDVIQSEARILTRGKKSKESPTGASTLQVDHSFLGCQHHKAIVAGMALMKGLLENGEKKRGLLVGLGGGGLAMFIHQFFPQVSMDVIELDDSVVDIAKTYFGCVEDKRLKIVVEDGLKFIEEAHLKEPKSLYHVIMLDVDSKDVTLGMSCPPKAFVGPVFLGRINDIIHSQGVFILNLVCRNKELRDTVLADIQSTFPQVYRVDIEDEVNEIIIALPEKEEGETNPEAKISSIQDSVKELQKYGKRKGSWDVELDLCEMVEGLQIV